MSSTGPVITVVLPTYRRPHLVGRAIQSVLNQTYPKFEVYVYDNASGDETRDVVLSFAVRDSRVKYHCHSENIGALRNFVFGAERVQTEFLVFLGDDDLILPGFFQTAMDAFERHQSPMMFLGNQIFANPDGAVIALPFAGWPEGLYQPPDAFFQWIKAPFGWSSAMFRRAAVENVGGLEASAAEFLDGDLMAKVASRYAVVFSPTPCAVFFEGGMFNKVALAAWRRAQMLTKRSMENDSAICSATRARMVCALDQFIDRATFRWGLTRAARYGGIEEARAAAAILRDADAPVSRVRLVELFGSESAAGNTARWAFRNAYRLRARIKRLAAYRTYRECDAALSAALKAATDGAAAVPDGGRSGAPAGGRRA